GEQALELGLVDGLSSASAVARDLVGVEEMVDFTHRESPVQRFSRQLGTSIGNTLAMHLGLAAPQLRRSVSGQAHALIPQHGAQPDQGQADQAVGVVATQGLKQTDAQAFHSEAAGTVVGLLALQVAFYAGVVQLAKYDIEGFAGQLMIAAGAVQQAQCGTEAYRAAAAAAQLVEGGGVVARLADRLTIKQQHLIRTYDQVLRVTSCKGPGLGQRQSPGQLLGG